MMKIFSLILLIYSASTLSESPMVYRYWDMGISAKRDSYQFELLKLALEKTRTTHGDYKLIRADQKITSIRASREVSRGGLINIEATPNWTTEAAPSELRHDKRIAVKIPLMENLLGYRQLVIRKNDVKKFAGITDASELKALVAGQGRVGRMLLSIALTAIRSIPRPITTIYFPCLLLDALIISRLA